MVREFHNDLILPVAHGGFLGSQDDVGRLCIGDKSLSKYITKQINPTINSNIITFGCESCIISMLLQYDKKNDC